MFLTCHTPSLPTLQDSASTLLNYTLVLDGAPGPDINNELLSLTLRKNPEFFGIDPNDRQYVVFSGKNISILVCMIHNITEDLV